MVLDHHKPPGQLLFTLHRFFFMMVVESTVPKFLKIAPKFPIDVQFEFDLGTVKGIAHNLLMHHLYVLRTIQCTPNRGGVHPSEITPVRIEMFHYKIKVSNQRSY